LIPIASQLTIVAIGFTKAGVALGSFAAAIQVPLIAKESLFALLQSVGAKSTLLSPAVFAVSIGTVAVVFYFSS